MTDNERFVKATDFLRKKRGVEITEISSKLGENRQKLYNIRRGSQEITLNIIEDLQKHYPEVKMFFEEGQDNYLPKEDDPPTYEVKSAKNIYSNLIGALQVAVDAQKVTIRTLEAKLEELKEENMKLKNEMDS